MEDEISMLYVIYYLVVASMFYAIAEYLDPDPESNFDNALVSLMWPFIIILLIVISPYKVLRYFRKGKK